MYYNNANNNTEKTTEHINTADIMQGVIKPFADAGLSEEVMPSCESEDMSVFEAILRAALKPRSSIPSKFEALSELLERAKGYESGMIKDALMYRIYEARLKLSRALLKDLNTAVCCDNNPYVLAVYLEDKDNFISLLSGIRNAKQNKKSTTSKAIVDNATLDYALSLVNGTVSRAKGTAESLKQAALWLAYYKDAANPMEYTAVDTALNKVFAAVRRQAKKNAVEISAKSNKVTKDAVKLAVMERIKEMQANHEYAFEVLIGEA